VAFRYNCASSALDETLVQRLFSPLNWQKIRHPGRCAIVADVPLRQPIPLPTLRSIAEPRIRR